MEPEGSCLEPGVSAETLRRCLNSSKRGRPSSPTRPPPPSRPCTSPHIRRPSPVLPGASAHGPPHPTQAPARNALLPDTCTAQCFQVSGQINALDYKETLPDPSIQSSAPSQNPASPHHRREYYALTRPRFCIDTLYYDASGRFRVLTSFATSRGSRAGS